MDEARFEPDWDEVGTCDPEGSPEVTPPVPDGGLMTCPAERCGYRYPADSMALHWTCTHRKDAVLILCPVDKCAFKSPRMDNLTKHFFNRHHATKNQQEELLALPPLAELVVNKFYKSPGGVNFGEPVVLPARSLPPSQKMTLKTRVTKILSDQLSVEMFKADLKCLKMKNRALEREVSKLKDSKPHLILPTKVGDLERLNLSQPLLLLPTMNFTTVLKLTLEDVKSLKSDDKLPSLSCECL